MQQTEPLKQHYDVIVVGAGMAGLYQLYKLCKAVFSAACAAGGGSAVG